MVTEYGMSSLGPIQYERSTGPVFLGRDYNKSKDFSEKMAIEIDNAVKEIIDECYKKAEKTLNDNLDLVKRIAYYLLEIETLTKDEIYEIVESHQLKWWDDKVAKENSKSAKEISKNDEEDSKSDEEDSKSDDEDSKSDEETIEIK
mgnify:CR=1 FL=1